HTVAAWQAHTFGEAFLSFSNEASLVAATDVRSHSNLTFILAASDDTRTIEHPQLGQLRQWDTRTVRGMDEDVPQIRSVGAGLWNISNGDIESPFTLEHRACRFSADRQLDQVGDIFNIDSISSEFLAVHHDA